MQPDDVRRSGPRQGRPDTNSTTDSIATWPDTFAGSQQWVRWNGRRRWPDFPVNDDIWAVSIADWATYGRRAA